LHFINGVDFMRKKKAVITGAGQDASYLAEFLLSKDYEVILFTRRVSVGTSTANIEQLVGGENFTFLYGDITDSAFVSYIINEYKPEEYYGLAAQSHVGYSFKTPVETFVVNAESVAVQLEMIKRFSPKTKFLNASTSEIFGGSVCSASGFDEGSPLNPRSPYAISKAAAYYITKNHREAYGAYAVNSICFNHSSIRRGHDFATRKMTSGIAAVKLGLQDTVKMGNLSPFRDEGCAKDYVEAMWLMLQQDEADDYLIATGSGATIEEMFRYVCELAGLEFDEVYEQDPKYMRPSDVQFLLGNPAKAKEKLGWDPKYDWKSLLKEMYENDIRELSCNL
jgi:GDPmannose 4,6-dehydratase